MSSSASPASPASAAPAVPTEPVDPNTVQLYVNNLAFHTTEPALEKHIADHIGENPSEVNIVTHKNSSKSKGFGFCRISLPLLSRALELNGSELDQRSIGVAQAVQRTDEEKQAARDKRQIKFQERQARIQAIRAEKQAAQQPHPNSNIANSHASVTAAAPSSAAAASSSSAKRTRGGGAAAAAAAAARAVPANCTQLYVNNLAFSLTADALRDLFTQHTPATPPLDVDLVTSRVGRYQGRSRGFGFVTVSNAALDDALNLNGRVVEGREIGVVIAKESNTRPSAHHTNGAEAENGDQAEGEAPQRPRRRRHPRHTRKPAANANHDVHPQPNGNHAAPSPTLTTNEQQANTA